MGQFRFEKKFVNFDINGHHRKVEHNDELLLKWSNASKEYQDMADQIDANEEGDTEELLDKFKAFFQENIYDAIFGRGAYDKDFDGLEIGVYDMMELYIYLATEIQAVENSRFTQYSGGSLADLNDYRKNRPKTQPAKKKRKR